MYEDKEFKQSVGIEWKAVTCEENMLFNYLCNVCYFKCESFLYFFLLIWLWSLWNEQNPVLSAVDFYPNHKNLFLLWTVLDGYSISMISYFFYFIKTLWKKLNY